MGMPPYSYQALLRADARKPDDAQRFCERLAAWAGASLYELALLEGDHNTIQAVNPTR